MGCLKTHRDYESHLRVIHRKKGQKPLKIRGNYYPFGLKHKGYNGVVNGVDHKYGFGGKEENDELGLMWHDFGARNYDASLGRWMNIDPLAEDMRRHSPYNYAFNNPIYWIDPDGMAPLDDYFNKEGEYLGSDDAKTDNVQIVSQEDWDANKKVGDDGKASISHEKGGEISTNITDTEISNDAVENVVEYYTEQIDSESLEEGVDIIAKPVNTVKGESDYDVIMRSIVGGGFDFFGFRIGESKDIIVNTADGKVSSLLNTASNIKNSIVHEHQHQKDSGLSLTRNQQESRAIKTQKAHTTYSKTTTSYKKNVDKYEKKYQ